MEDHHVDRLDVEAPRGVKLTSTNSSIGLIVLIVHAHQRARRTDDADLLSSRAVGPADGAPNDWRRALRLRPSADGKGED